MEYKDLKNNKLYTATEYASAMKVNNSRITYLNDVGKLKTVSSESGRGYLVRHCKENETLFPNRFK